MSFNQLNKAELAEVAQFFQRDVVAADEDKGPSKKELLAAIEGGDDAVTWGDYNDIYLVAKESGKTGIESDDDDAEGDEVTAPAPVANEPTERDLEDKVLIKYGRNNPTFEIVGYTFTKRHPFATVPTSVAEHLIRNVEGFRLAMPSEVSDYYN